MKLKNFNDLLAKVLFDIQYIQKNSLSLYPKMQEKLESQKIKDVIEQHMAELRKESARVGKILKQLNIQNFGESSAKSIFSSAEKLLQENTPSPLLDAAIIYCIEQIEYNELAAYSMLEAFAESLDLDEMKTFLDESIREINKIDNVLENLAESDFYSSMKV